MDKLKIIKTVVVILTFLLVFGSLTALGSIFNRLNNKPSPKDLYLNQPFGSYIHDFKVSDNKTYLLIKGGNKPDRIIIASPTETSVINLFSAEQQNGK